MRETVDTGELGEFMPQLRALVAVNPDDGISLERPNDNPIARQDVDYLEWLQRATFGRRLRSEIEALLVQRRGPGTAGRAPSGQQWNRRR